MTAVKFCIDSGYRVTMPRGKAAAKAAEIGAAVAGGSGSEPKGNIWAVMQQNLSSGFPKKRDSNQSPMPQALDRIVKFCL